MCVLIPTWPADLFSFFLFFLFFQALFSLYFRHYMLTVIIPKWPVQSLTHTILTHTILTHTRSHIHAHAHAHTTHHTPLMSLYDNTEMAGKNSEKSKLDGGFT